MKIPVKFSEPGNPVHQDINSHSEERMFFSAEGLDPTELRLVARDIVRAVASGCEVAGAKDVSHVKAFIEYSSGFIHADTVSGNGEIMVAGRDGNRTKRFHMVLNAVIYGLPEGSIKTVSEQALDAVEVQYGLTREQGKG